MAPKKRSRTPRGFLAPFNPSDILERVAAIGTLALSEMHIGVPGFSVAPTPTGLLQSGHTPGVGSAPSGLSSAHIPAAVLHPVQTLGVGSADPPPLLAERADRPNILPTSRTRRRIQRKVCT